MNTNENDYHLHSIKRYEEGVVLKDVSELVGYEGNSRTHSTDQVAQLAASIEEFGFTNPVLIDPTGVIVAGHGRLMAARKLGMEQVPCLVLSGLSETQLKAYVIADNKLALNAGWDLDVLAIELETLKALDFDISLTGFSTVETLVLGDATEDEVKPSKKAVWEMGDHRLTVSAKGSDGDIEAAIEAWEEYTGETAVFKSGTP